MIEVREFKYTDHWPVWCVINDEGQVICCRKSESEAQEVMRSIRGGENDE
jgi:hypothetical protein